ncbi:killer cell lectin-like receptor subfamily G member 2 [Serinus canaria]|uniref:killer cell lectin-like receptor subfamily G member 2 n=1 Tax=Serinus canaria TaxID=9135 RepID=UPI0021CC8743|nr:killer cell lectin-like receptor subfamily G member 2 [Serinus canaria]
MSGKPQRRARFGRTRSRSVRSARLSSPVDFFLARLLSGQEPRCRRGAPHALPPRSLAPFPPGGGSVSLPQAEPKPRPQPGSEGPVEPAAVPAEPRRWQCRERSGGGERPVRVTPQWRRHPERGGAAAELGGGSSPGCHQRRSEAVPEADLPKALSALLMSPEQGADGSRQRDSGYEQDESEFCAIPGAANESQHLQEGPAAEVELLPGVQEVTWHQQGDAPCERAVSADVENGFCTRDGSVREPLGPQGTSATNNEHKRNLRRLLGEWFRSHPVLMDVLILLVLLVLALGVALAVQSATQVPITPATLPSFLGCPPGWVGYNGVCYYFSRDYSTWEQGQERCSQLNASLAIAKDEEAMDLLFRLRGNGDFWLGLRRRGERLQWEDGSSYSSRVPVLGNSQCVYLADENRLKSEFCSNERPYVCSKAQAPL